MIGHPPQIDAEPVEAGCHQLVIEYGATVGLDSVLQQLAPVAEHYPDLQRGLAAALWARPGRGAINDDDAIREAVRLKEARPSMSLEACLTRVAKSRHPDAPEVAEGGGPTCIASIVTRYQGRLRTERRAAAERDQGTVFSLTGSADLPAIDDRESRQAHDR